MNISTAVFRNTVSNTIGKLAVVLLSFALTPYILARLNATDYGIWVLVSSVVGYGSLLEFGLAGAVTKYVAEYRALKRLDKAAEAILAALTLYILLGLAAILLSVVLAPYFPRLFKVPVGKEAETIALVIITGVGVGTSIPAATSTAVLCGLQRFDVSSFFTSSTAILSSVAMAVTLYLGGGLLEMMESNIGVSILMQIPTVWFIRKLEPDLRFRGWTFNVTQIKALLSFSWSLFILQVSWRLRTRTDEMVIGAALPISQVTPYALARRLSEAAQLITQQFLKVLAPLASQLHAENDPARLRSVYVTGTRVSLAIFLPAGVVLIMLAGPILTAWVGASYAQHANIVVILTISSLIDTCSWPAGAVLQGIGRHHRVALNSALSALVNLGLSVLLVTRMGVVGVAWGTLIPTVLSGLGYVLPHTMKVLGIRPREIVKEIVLPAFLPLIPATVVIYILRETLGSYSFVFLLAIALAGASAYALTYLLVGADATERRAYGTFFSSTIRFLSHNRMFKLVP